MMVFAVTLHNIPEGMAVGVTFAGALIGNTGITMAGAFALALGIAIQNFPEGAIISMPLKSEGMSKPKAFLYGMLSGIVEPIGAIITILLANNKGKVNWIKEVEKSNDYQITVNNCNEKETIVPNEVLNEISKKLNNISDNGPWTGDNNKCYSSLIISFSKESQIEYITIKLIDNNSFVLSTSGNDRYYTNSAELNNYINELINTY